MTEWSPQSSTAAPGWEANAERIDESLRAVTDWLLQRADVRAGQVVLDVAAGPGGVGHRAAELVGPQGRVVSTDWAAAMVDLAKRIGASRGLSNVEYRVMDAHSMHLEDDAVDVVLCRHGFMLMVDPIEALRQTRRVLKPGGNLAFSVFASPERNPFTAVPQRVFIELGHIPEPSPGSPGVFAMSDASIIRAALADSGFAAEAIETIDLQGSMPDGDFIVDRIVEMNPMVGRVYRDLNPDAQTVARHALLDEFEAFQQADGSYVLPSQIWGVHAR
ncbi:MAG: class I SAM-dependent methyltransferase [Acidimicrobiales bacterium]